MEAQDRSTGLILFGVGEILLGGLLGLFSLGMAAAFVLRDDVAAALTPRMALASTLEYASLAAGFIILGIGSIRARRWARALILALSWMWLVMGLLGLVAAVLFMPGVLDAMPDGDPVAKSFVVAVMAITFGVVLLLLPLALVLFYRSPHVKATVEARDPAPSWTDDVPMPLLIFGTWMLFGAWGLLVAGWMYPALPLGPFMLRGAAVPAFAVAVGIVFLVIGVGALKKRRAAWWAALGLLVTGGVWSALTFTQQDPQAWAEMIPTPADSSTVKMVEELYSGPTMMLWMGCLFSAYLVFLIFLRRYFFDASASHASS